MPHAGHYTCRVAANSAQLGKQGLLDGVDAAFAVELNVLGLPFGGQILEEIGRGQGAVLGVVIDVVALVDGRLVLVVAALEIASRPPL